MSNDPTHRKFNEETIALCNSSCNLLTSKSMNDVPRFDLLRSPKNYLKLLSSTKNKPLRMDDIHLAEPEIAKTGLSSYCAVLALS